MGINMVVANTQVRPFCNRFINCHHIIGQFENGIIRSEINILLMGYDVPHVSKRPVFRCNERYQGMIFKVPGFARGKITNLILASNINPVIGSNLYRPYNGFIG